MSTAQWTGEPDGHSSKATTGRELSATPGPPGPPNNIRHGQRMIHARDGQTTVAVGAYLHRGGKSVYRDPARPPGLRRPPRPCPSGRRRRQQHPFLGPAHAGPLGTTETLWLDPARAGDGDCSPGATCGQRCSGLVLSGWQPASQAERWLP